VPGLTTSEILREIRRIRGVAMPRTTVIRWVERGLARPSIRRDTVGGRGHAHVWSEDDLVLLIWMAAARDVVASPAMRAAIRDLWTRHAALLRQPPPLVMVRVGHHLDIVTWRPLADVRDVPDAGISIWRLWTPPGGGA
jgi:hypothetical protein